MNQQTPVQYETTSFPFGIIMVILCIAVFVSMRVGYLIGYNHRDREAMTNPSTNGNHTLLQPVPTK